MSAPSPAAPSGSDDEAKIDATKGTKTEQDVKKAQERERLARALRENLRRRKEQARSRKDTDEAQ